MGVALVVTVRDEASSIFDLLAAIDGQTLAPNEIVIVDGGSSDGTVKELERWARLRPTVNVVSAPGASIPAGRNIAISGHPANGFAMNLPAELQSVQEMRNGTSE